MLIKILADITEVISITSGKGGVGKTTVTVNTAIALADLGYKTLIVDADKNNSSAHKQFDIQDLEESTVQKYILSKNDTDLDKLIFNKYGVDYLNSFYTLESTKVTKSAKDHYLNYIDTKIKAYDYVIMNFSRDIPDILFDFIPLITRPLFITHLGKECFEQVTNIMKAFYSQTSSSLHQIDYKYYYLLVNEVLWKKQESEIPSDAKRTYKEYRQYINQNITPELGLKLYSLPKADQASMEKSEDDSLPFIKLPNKDDFNRILHQDIQHLIEHFRTVPDNIVVRE